jgi:hypothetical protein
MGHYRKKEYKKKSVNNWLHRDYTFEIQEALDTYDTIEDSSEIFGAELTRATMPSPPLIVHELREEERMGSLPTWMVDPDAIHSLDTFLIDLAIRTKMENSSIPPIRDEEYTYKQAKKIADLL